MTNATETMTTETLYLEATAALEAGRPHEAMELIDALCDRTDGVLLIPSAKHYGYRGASARKLQELIDCANEMTVR